MGTGKVLTGDSEVMATDGVIVRVQTVVPSAVISASVKRALSILSLTANCQTVAGRLRRSCIAISIGRDVLETENVRVTRIVPPSTCSQSYIVICTPTSEWPNSVSIHSHFSRRCRFGSGGGFSCFCCCRRFGRCRRLCRCRGFCGCRGLCIASHSSCRASSCPPY